MLSKKDYTALVQLVRDFNGGLGSLELFGTGAKSQIVELLIARLAWFCAQDNPNFDSFRFVEACKKVVR